MSELTSNPNPSGVRPAPTARATDPSRAQALVLSDIAVSLYPPARTITESSQRFLFECDLNVLSSARLELALSTDVAPPVPVITPAAAVAILEPLEIMDFDDDPDFYEEPGPLSAAEPPAPPLTELFPVRFDAAAPRSPELLPPLGFTPFAAHHIEMAEIPLRTVRPKLRRGPDPNAPVPAPASEAVVEPPPAPQPEAVPERRPAEAQPPKPSAPERVTKVTVRPEREKRNRPAPPPPSPSRPAIAAHGNAVPAHVEPAALPTPPAPPARPKIMEMPARKVEPAPVPSLQIASPVAAGMSGTVKGAIAAVAAVVLLGGGYFAFSGKSTTGSSSSTAGASSDTASSLVVGGGGWTTTWGNETPTNKGKQISIYRPSMAMSDYRFEFRGQIEKKALGWLFRATNPKNYYVMKLEVMKPGPTPLVALVRYAVIEGKDTTKTQVMLPFEVKLDTLYQVRLDVRGDKFSTYVQGKLVDFWTDGRLKIGGTGFYAEPGERASVKSSQVSYLAAAAQ